MPTLQRPLAFLALSVALAVPAGAAAQGSSRTEAQYLGGVAVVGGAASPTGFQHALVLQHDSAWSRGYNFFWLEMLCCEDPVANREAFLEWYSTLDLGALIGSDLSFGPVRGLGINGGVNWGAQSRFTKFTPGLRLMFDLPGFTFANLNLNWLVDFGEGPRDDAVLDVDFSWGRPFEIGGASFSAEGHIEWQSPHDRGDGGRAPYVVLLQPQLRYDLGKTLSGAAGRLLVGTELLVWRNKFRVEGAHEFLPKLMVVFGF